MKKFRYTLQSLFAALQLAILLAVASPAIMAAEEGFGVLVMAHGGIPEWEQGVLSTVAPLQADYPLEVAFGMADAHSLQEAITRLETRGVNRIAVIRLFISGESWYERTAQILGLAEGAPERPTAALSTASHGGHETGDQQQAMPVHRMEFWRVDSQARFAMSTQGLAEADEMTGVLATRARDLSRNPENEDVLVLAHGPEDDAENIRWIEDITARAEPIRGQGFRRVRIVSLREDWEAKRLLAEQEIRGFVQSAMAEGRTTLVIPFRVHGFGPYAKVLENLEYRADEKGLIPHQGVTDWIRRQIQDLERQLSDA